MEMGLSWEGGRKEGARGQGEGGRAKGVRGRAGGRKWRAGWGNRGEGVECEKMAGKL